MFPPLFLSASGLVFSFLVSSNGGADAVAPHRGYWRWRIVLPSLLFFLSRIAIGMWAVLFCLFLYRRLAMKNGRGGRIALSEIPFRASPPCLSDFRRLCPKGCLCFRCGLFRPAGWTGSFLYFFFSLPLTVALLPVAAGALAFVRWAAGGHGQQCIVSGFHFFVFFLLPRGRSSRFLSFYLPPRRRAGAGA